MADKKFELQSGATLNVTTAPFQDANALLKALMKAAEGLPLAANPMEMDLAMLKDALIHAATSDAVEDALFKCFQRVQYDSQKMNRDLLDDPKIGDKVRGDYFMVCWHVIEVNCGPFFEQAFSLLKARQKTPAESPKPK